MLPRGNSGFVFVYKGSIVSMWKFGWNNYSCGTTARHSGTEAHESRTETLWVSVNYTCTIYNYWKLPLLCCPRHQFQCDIVQHWWFSCTGSRQNHVAPNWSPNQPQISTLGKYWINMSGNGIKGTKHKKLQSTPTNYIPCSVIPQVVCNTCTYMPRRESQKPRKWFWNGESHSHKRQ